jgi:hypothetical protein
VLLEASTTAVSTCSKVSSMICACARSTDGPTTVHYSMSRWWHRRWLGLIVLPLALLLLLLLRRLLLPPARA